VHKECRNPAAAHRLTSCIKALQAAQIAQDNIRSHGDSAVNVYSDGPSASHSPSTQSPSKRNHHQNGQNFPHSPASAYNTNGQMSGYVPRASAIQNHALLNGVASPSQTPPHPPNSKKTLRFRTSDGSSVNPSGTFSEGINGYVHDNGGYGDDRVVRVTETMCMSNGSSGQK
jgi:hypothetical protein